MAKPMGRSCSSRRWPIRLPVTERTEGALQAIRAAFTVDGVRDQSVNAAPVLDEHSALIREALARDPAHWPSRPQPKA
jgi:hypothetical protein